MATSVTFNGTTYSIPAAQEVGWAVLSNFLIDVGTNAQTTGSQKATLRVATSSPVTVANTDYCVVTNLSVAGTVAVNLPAGSAGKLFVIIDGKGDAATNNITITPNGADTINGSATWVINSNRDAIILQYNSTNTTWNVHSVYRSNGLTTVSSNTGSGRVQNKDLDDDSVKFVDSGDTTKAFEVEISGSATGTTTTLATTSATSAILSLPPATSSLLSRISADQGANRVKNKDLETTTTQFVDGSDATKIAKFDISGATTGKTLTLAGPITNNRTITFPDLTDTLVGKTTTDTLTNKSLTSVVITDYQDVTAAAAPGTPASGKARIYVKTDKRAYLKDDGGTEVPLSGGGTAESITTKTNTDYTILDNDGFTTILFSTGNTNRTCTLPAAANNQNRIIRLKKIDAGTGKVNVSGTVDGVTKVLVDQYDYLSVQSDGTNWYLLDIGSSTESRIRLEGAQGYGSTNTKIRRFLTSVVSTGNAITYADSATLGGTFTINQDGWYSIHYSDSATAGDNEHMGISVNSAQLTTNIGSITNTARYAIAGNSVSASGFNSLQVSLITKLGAGDVVRAHTEGGLNSTAAADVSISIARVRPA